MTAILAVIYKVGHEIEQATYDADQVESHGYDSQDFIYNVFHSLGHDSFRDFMAATVSDPASDLVIGPTATREFE